MIVLGVCQVSVIILTYTILLTPAGDLPASLGQFLHNFSNKVFLFIKVHHPTLPVTGIPHHEEGQGKHLQGKHHQSVSPTQWHTVLEPDCHTQPEPLATSTWKVLTLTLLLVMIKGTGGCISGAMAMGGEFSGVGH